MLAYKIGIRSLCQLLFGSLAQIGVWESNMLAMVS